MIKNFINKVIGDPNEKAIKRIRPLVGKINQLADEYKNTITDQNAVLAKTTEFKQRLKDGETLDDILPEAFALVKVACSHLVGKSWPVRGHDVTWEIESPYDVQLIGGIVLHQGNIAEMKTGEGKTLVCTMPVYLNALTEKGVFVVTVNEYLASRDAEWMGGLYNYLGLSVGVTGHGMSHQDKKAAYNCDITYGTNNEFGFDYLRDNMTSDPTRVVQRELNYAIVDEVDSILIDESRTPLIISAPAQESTAKYQRYSTLINQLEENKHYDIDEKSRTAVLTEEGIAKMEQILGLSNIYTEAGFSEVHHIEQALRAKACYKADRDYIISEGKIVIIDEFTGRLMPGRRYSKGLHQAIEAKESVEIKRESKTLATITFQNYFRMFDKLAGMTGTAATEADEFYQIYGLDTIIIPTNRPIARIDRKDSIYKTKKGKYIAAGRKIKELHEKGQPVLVGTISVEQSEIISKLLKMEGVPHNILNAKNHEREAEIVSRAGDKGAVTIATNMAGRGTDIKIRPEILQLGGLFVLGTERHESRRIDNQLRGRSGRQGDPGESQFFVSMEDDLMRLFGGDRIKNMMDTFKVPEDMPIENGIISRSIEGAQKKVEGRNFDIRKHLVEYDDVMNAHRNIVYRQRQEFLKDEDMSARIQEMIEETTEIIVTNHTEARPPSEWEYEEIEQALTAIHKDPDHELDLSSIKDQAELISRAKAYLTTAYKTRENSLPDTKIMRAIEKAIYLRASDTLWKDHIDYMNELRGNVAFSGFAQKNPLTEYQSQGYELFRDLLGMIRQSTVTTLFKIDLDRVVPASMNAKSEEENANATEQSSKSQTAAASTTQAPLSSDQKVGRNEPCPCGSGKKYKKCHGAA